MTVTALYSALEAATASASSRSCCFERCSETVLPLAAALSEPATGIRMSRAGR